MAYSELIKNFEKVRAYMREFYVYGFKSRTEYDAKSARSYGAGGVPGRGEIPMSSVSSRTPVDFLLRIWGMRSS